MQLEMQSNNVLTLFEPGRAKCFLWPSAPQGCKVVLAGLCSSSDSQRMATMVKTSQSYGAIQCAGWWEYVCMYIHILPERLQWTKEPREAP